ncbi:MAG: hypothetical protein ACPG5L_18245 [Vibrio gallaecicus]
MAVQPKHGDRPDRLGFGNDFTTDQRHRFTEVANQAQKRRKNKKEIEARFFESAKKAAFKPLVSKKPDSSGAARQDKNVLRQVIWVVVIGLVSLWAMYMTN